MTKGAPGDFRPLEGERLEADQPGDRFEADGSDARAAEVQRLELVQSLQVTQYPARDVAFVQFQVAQLAKPLKGRQRIVAGATAGQTEPAEAGSRQLRQSCPGDAPAVDEQRLHCPRGGQVRESVVAQRRIE